MYDSGYEPEPEPELDSSSDDNPLSELFAELRKISAHSKPLSTVNSEGVAKNETIEQKEPKETSKTATFIDDIICIGPIEVHFEKNKIYMNMPCDEYDWKQGKNFGKYIHIALLYELSAIQILGRDLVQQNFGVWFQELIKEEIILRVQIEGDNLEETIKKIPLS
tara:strand:- start:6866 stop:7360 length:495 start_codon:yes stop_codon:yes gene_type:complete